jgi:dTDP-L-rhamnose 4-epimerase
MVTKKVLITGGAGFIGSHLADKLIGEGHSVTVYDILDPQVHPDQKKPVYLNPNIDFIQADVRNIEKMEEVLKDIEVVYHLAAAVGVGQSMYQIDRFLDVNSGGTAKLLDFLVNKSHSVKKVIVASSNTIYGEGKCDCDHCKAIIKPQIRSKQQLEKNDWELHCPICNNYLIPKATDENTAPDCTSIYAMSKKNQEDMVLMIGKTYGLDTTAFRFFLVYGSRQALTNPYTGVCAIFSTNLLNGNPPLIYEDGNQSRDFVHVKDICQGLYLGMIRPEAKHEVFNIGSGEQITITDVARSVAKHINPEIKPQITQKFRPGDIRHCYADISKISQKLGYTPKYSFQDGIKEVISWVKSIGTPIKDRTAEANKELQEKGLL